MNMAMRIAGALGFTIVCSMPAFSQNYPLKSVRVIVGTSAGSGADLIARLIGSGMTPVLGQQVVVENRAGASGSIASEFVAKSAPDGYTVIQLSGSNSITTALGSKLPYDLLRDFAPVTLVAVSPNAVVAHPSLPVKSVAELVKLAKARPGAISFGSAGITSPSFTAGALFGGVSGVKMLHVPYRGGGEALTAVLTGETQLMFGPIASTLPLIRSGNLRLLALTSSKRIPLLPETPTVAEAGYPSYQAGNWYGLAVPAKTPPDIITALRNSVIAALGDAKTRQRLLDFGYVIVGDQPDEFTAHMKSEIEALSKSFRALGLKVD